MEYFITFAFTHFLATFGPGLCTFAVIKSGILHGFASAKKVAISVATIDSIYGILAVIGLGELISSSEFVAKIVQFFSGGYLLFLGIYTIYGYLKNRSKGAGVPDDGVVSAGKNFYIYGIVNGLLNIKTIILYIAILSELMRILTIPEKIGYVFWFVIMNFAIYLFMARFVQVAVIRKFMLEKFEIINLAFGIMLIASALKILT